jgi:hypothetical protein
MTLKSRRFVFYSLVAAFFIIGGGVIFYVSGWRIDLSTLAAKKVGAIFIRSLPRDTEIYLDGKAFKNKSWLLQNGTLIENLFPKNYELKLAYDGYEPWKENLSVAPSLVTEVKYAVLIPKKTSEVATGTVKNFWLLGDNYLVQDEKNNLYLDSKKIGGGDAVGWTNNLQNILIYNPENYSYSLYNTASGNKIDVNTTLAKLGFNTKVKFKILVDEADKTKLIALEPKRVSLLDLNKNSLTSVYKATSTQVGDNAPASQFFIAWADFNGANNTSSIKIYDKLLQRMLNGYQVFKGGNIKLEWIDNNRLAVLQNDGSLYIYDASGNNSQKVADDVKSFEFTSDGTVLAALENSALEIFFFSGEKDYYRFNLPEMKSVEDIVWYYDTNHLFVVYPDHISFLDIHDAGLSNFTTIMNSRAAQYDGKNNSLYFTSGANINRLDFPK